MTKINVHAYKFTHVFGYNQASAKKCYAPMYVSISKLPYLLNKNHIQGEGKWELNDTYHNFRSVPSS